MKIFYILLVFSCQVLGQDKSILFYLDEDLKPLLQFSKDNDQNYTMGLVFGYASQNLNGSMIFRGIEFIDHKTLPARFTNSDVSLQASLTLNGTAFTPNDLRAGTIIKEDRPYAFLLYTSLKKQYLHNREYIATELNIGILGLDLGRWVQTNIHEALNKNDTQEPYTPRGWQHQISKGGEPTLLYAVNYNKLLEQKSFFDLKYGAQAMLGYYTNVNIEIAGRFGILDKNNWTRNYTPLGTGNKNRMLSMKGVKKRKAEAFLFVSIKPSVVLYNQMLNGGIRKSAHTLSWNETNHFVLEWNSGIGTTIPTANANSLEVIWVVNSGRTSEINTPLARSHQWGGIYLSYNF